jgi:hypothetical protein
MKRILSVLGAAFGGATVGYVAHQLVRRQASPETASPEVIVGAPPATALVATAIGIVFGRSKVSAFFAGAAITLAVGDKLDLVVTAMVESKRTETSGVA